MEATDDREVLGLGNYVRIKEGLSEAAVQEEARCCLRGDLCIGCDACTQVCPTGAIRLEGGNALRHTITTNTVVCAQQLLEYANAALPMQTPARCDYIRKRVHPLKVAHLSQP